MGKTCTFCPSVSGIFLLFFRKKVHIAQLLCLDSHICPQNVFVTVTQALISTLNPWTKFSRIHMQMFVKSFPKSPSQSTWLCLLWLWSMRIRVLWRKGLSVSRVLTDILLQHLLHVAPDVSSQPFLCLHFKIKSVPSNFPGQAFRCSSRGQYTHCRLQTFFIIHLKGSLIHSPSSLLQQCQALQAKHRQGSCKVWTTSEHSCFVSELPLPQHL